MTPAERNHLAQQQGDKVFKRSLLITGVGSLLIIIAVVLGFMAQPVDQVLEFLAQLSQALLFWRIVLFALFIGGWNHWTHWYRHWGHLDEAQFMRLRQLRWPVAAWLVLFELLVTQNILGQFLDSLISLFH